MGARDAVFAESGNEFHFADRVVRATLWSADDLEGQPFRFLRPCFRSGVIIALPMVRDGCSRK